MMATSTWLKLHGQLNTRQRLPPVQLPLVGTHLSVNVRLILAQHTAQAEVSQLQEAGKQKANRQMG